jgi:inorganic pyrophosphatase
MTAARFFPLALLPLLPILTLTGGAGPQPPAPLDLPAVATTRLVESLEAAGKYQAHVWRDTPAFNADGTVNGYVEIARGDRQKWEYRMPLNARDVDRVMPETLGGYPVNYGYVPQTISYDGDPFDILVLGPPIEGGTLVRGVIVGVMFMEDEKGHDSKVVVSVPGPDGRPRDRLTDEDERRIGDFFKRYKDHEPAGFSRIPGWGSAAEGLAYVKATHAFFHECRARAGATCRVAP